MLCFSNSGTLPKALKTKSQSFQFKKYKIIGFYLRKYGNSSRSYLLLTFKSKKWRRKKVFFYQGEKCDK